MIEMIGRRFGRLVVLSRAASPKRLPQWHCACDCGNETVVCGSNLRRGLTTSCKCLHKEITAAAARTHGLSKSRIYRIWLNMVARCANRDDPRYGGRGITVCARWQKFENFYEDMGEPPTRQHSLDRRDNDGRYEKDNCRWATARVQARNTSANRVVRFMGSALSLVEHCEIVGLPYRTVHQRIKRGWTVHKALSTQLI